MGDFRDYRSTHVGQYFGLLETFPWSQNENVLLKKKKVDAIFTACFMFLFIGYLEK